MGERASFRFENGPAGRADDLLCTIEVADRSLIGHDAKFELVAEVKVKDSRAVDAHCVLYEQVLRIDTTRLPVRIPRARVRAFSYAGSKIGLRILTRLRIADGVLLDSVLSEEQQLTVGLKPAVSTDSKALVEPKDLFDFFANLKAIPPASQLVTLVLAIVGGALLVANALVGAHDQFVPEAQTWLYSQRDSDGDGQLPLVNALMASGALGAALWAAMRRQLRKYMQFHLSPNPGRIRRGSKVRAAALFGGSSRVPLENATLRIVAANMECGQYRRGSGTKERTVSFKEPARGVILYEKRVPLILKGMPLSRYFDDAVDFDPMFRALYPPFMVSGSHGLNVHWEVQLLHPAFVDQELVGPAGLFEYEDFLDA